MAKMSKWLADKRKTYHWLRVTLESIPLLASKDQKREVRGASFEGFFSFPASEMMGCSFLLGCGFG